MAEENQEQPKEVIQETPETPIEEVQTEKVYTEAQVGEIIENRIARERSNLNKRLGRTEIMPFAPIVIGEKANDVFITNNKSHYTAEFMTMCYDTREEWIDKIPAVIHEVDKSARPQLVYENNPFYNVLVEYEKLSNIPVLLNTSFNVHGEPIIDGPDQAINHLMDGVVDYLVMEDFIYYVNR